ncbi:hypothetical protein ACLK17_08015 [Escherichia coli]
MLDAAMYVLGFPAVKSVNAHSFRRNRHAKELRSIWRVGSGNLQRRRFVIWHH